MSTLRNILNMDKVLSEKNGVFYFSSVHGDIKPSLDKDPEDQSAWSQWRKENFIFFKDQLGKGDASLVLADIGAGQSDFRKLVSNFDLVSVDFYPYSGINVVCDFLSGLPFKDGSVDIVLLSNVLEHIPEPEKFLNECLRVLKSGGVLLGSVPFIIGVHQRPYDFYRYTDIALHRILGARGFGDIIIKPVLGSQVIVFAILARIFNDLAKTKFAIFTRVLWKLIRTGFWAMDPLFKKVRQDADWPLGYLFKALKR